MLCYDVEDEERHREFECRKAKAPIAVVWGRWRRMEEMGPCCVNQGRGQTFQGELQHAQRSRSMKRAVGVVEWSITALRHQLWGRPGECGQIVMESLVSYGARVLCRGRPNLHFTKTVFSSPEDGVGALETGGRPTGQSS